MPFKCLLSVFSPSFTFLFYDSIINTLTIFRVGYFVCTGVDGGGFRINRPQYNSNNFGGKFDLSRVNI